MENEAELRKQILQLEFQHKKEMAEIRESHERITKLIEHNQKQLNHITQLTGFSFEEVGEINKKLESASLALSPKIPSKS